jgi:hypothetical protein
MLGGLALLGLVAVSSRRARSADHAEAPADPAADLADLYAFLDEDRIVMMLTAHPFAEPGATFSTTTQYVFHTSSGPAFGENSIDVDVICTFASDRAASCWVGSEDYASGDPSDASAPLTSESGKLRVFAGLRGDPFFFNLSGFVDTVDIVKQAAGSLTFDTAGCPQVDAATSQALVATLSEVPSQADPSRTNPDDFVNANVLALVVSIEKSLLTEGGPILSIWASTNEAP